MSPHALTPDHDERRPDSLGRLNGLIANGNGNSDHAHESLLQRFDDDEVHDLICVGFGPASLAIAIALHDALEKGEHLRSQRPKVRFLERQEHFAWHAGMLLPGAKMQISFLKDLATLRDPKSEFTFLNYLYRNDRLVPFTNLGTFLPQRIEYENYMRWCAGHFDEVVDYSQDVESIKAGRTNSKTGAIQEFEVASRDRRNGRIVTRRAKHVVIAAGGKPNIPQCLDARHPRVLHSSEYATKIGSILPPGQQPKSIAVIGAGQSAAEVFHNLPSRFPDAKSYLLVRGSALRPSDDSPFVNEIFDPERVDDVYSQDPQTRAEVIAVDKGTNYSVVRLELLEEIYASLYSYRIQFKDEDDWPQRILNHRSVIGMSDNKAKDTPAIRLHIEDASGEYHARKTSRKEALDVDLVIVASGYRRNAHEDMLKDLNNLKPGENAENGWQVDRDYSVNFEEGAVQDDAGIWLQGCNEKTHGLSDTLLSILATRAGEMVSNIFGR